MLLPHNADCPQNPALLVWSLSEEPTEWGIKLQQASGGVVSDSFKVDGRGLEMPSVGKRRGVPMRSEPRKVLSRLDRQSVLPLHS